MPTVKKHTTRDTVNFVLCKKYSYHICQIIMHCVEVSNREEARSNDTIEIICSNIQHNIKSYLRMNTMETELGARLTLLALVIQLSNLLCPTSW